MLKDSDVPPANPVLGGVTGVHRRIIMVQNKLSTAPKSGSSMLDGKEQIVQDSGVHKASDGLISHRFPVDKALVIKECDQHALGMASSPSLKGLLWSWCIAIEPLLAVLFGLWSVQVDVALVACDDLLHESTLIMNPIQCLLCTSQSDLLLVVI